MDKLKPNQVQRYKNIKSVFFILLASVLLVAMNAFLFSYSNSNKTAVTQPTDQKTNSLPSYSIATVSEHNTPTDCWMAAYGFVYDITTAVNDNNHPGGQNALISGCGKDATETFDRIHSDRARTELEVYKIGTLE